MRRVYRWLPPLVRDAVRRWRRRGVRWSSAPQDWAAAGHLSSGYADADIAARVAAATRAVVSGQAAYERDSVLFTERDFRYPVVTALMHVAALNRGCLEVVDFGGALGSAFWQCRVYLDQLQSVRWQVVEQPSFVEAGREFTSDRLSFVSDVAALSSPAVPPLVLAGGVLQCIENPYAALDKLAGLRASHMLIDRLPLFDAAEDHLCIQRVPQSIYAASYPTWIFSRSRMLAHLSPQWRVVSEFSCEEGVCRTDEGLSFEFRGLYLEACR